MFGKPTSDEMPALPTRARTAEAFVGETELKELGVSLEFGAILTNQKNAAISVSTNKPRSSSITEVEINLSFYDDRAGNRIIRIAEFEVNPYLRKRIRPKSKIASNYVVAIDSEGKRTFVGEPESSLFSSLQFVE